MRFARLPLSLSPLAAQRFRTRALALLGLLAPAAPALTLTLAAPAAHAAQPLLGSVQLTFTPDDRAAYLNGTPTQWLAPPRLLGGRTMLPLRETAALLGQTMPGNGSVVQLARLSIDTRANTAALAGVPQPAGTVALVGGVTYVSARTLADALNANLTTDDGRTFTLTALRDGGNPLIPQARFSTDKTVYAPGERVVYTEYPFDPDGADITARKWNGRQEVFFQPGTYTIGLTVTNSRGLQSAPFTRTIRVEGTPIDTPLTYALKYAQPGDAFPDPQILTYPSALATPVEGPSYPLLFSDSPEVPDQSGILYQDSVAGRARLLAYHLNGLGKPARLYVMARNLESRPVEVRTERLGETAPTRLESILGQVTLLEYFASGGGTTLTLAPGQAAAVYASPTLNPGSGVNVMQDLSTSGRVDLTFLILEDGLPPTAQVAQQLPYLKPDGRHVRGTFPQAVRTLRVNLGALPTRIVIGDGQVDPALTGTDALTGQGVRLAGNYGVLYDLEVNGAAGTAVALSPRGGLYRGAMNIQDGPITQTIKLPRTGNALKPDEPVLLWRAQSDRLNIDFVPSSGSNLPISLVFYRTRGLSGYGGITKTYQP
ncbi:copper amine oxidase N-terminal domain-containing protein [Deinococcus multiflagellatus]|uniref:Copper amine oxidase N-terminal domain-containing protein n=1 Tax=Deinococcus multiflagellatus TaxID=1656887 RepID=A0ABW1ZM52_9DEIO|nr:copper amine oxidase N-terminal domain-containing protein [Deinococcus multiflagellatus]MBZ9714877.1 copper amine oxidase N-terminal domain-containing protein [Deinococcus multiflagellatus]